MATPICPTCSCSLVRLKITRDKAAVYRYGGEDFYFCCQGCVDLFIIDPQKYLQEIESFIVCPTCLAEKPRELAVMETVSGQEIYFCRCPHCIDAFRATPDYFLNRLTW